MRITAINKHASVGSPNTEKPTTMRAPEVPTDEYAPRVEHRIAKKSKHPMTMKSPQEKDDIVCAVVTAANAMGVRVPTLLQALKQAVVLAKDWAATHAENPDFRKDVKSHPVKNKHIFDESAERIAQYFKSAKVSPDGVGQAVKKLNWYLVRGGDNIPKEKRAKVSRAIAILQKDEK